MVDISERIARLPPEKLAQFLERLGKGAAGAPGEPVEEGIPRRVETGPSVLSFAQERLWFLAQLNPEHAAYNTSRSLRLRGTLQVAWIADILAFLVERHEALRTTFPAEEGKARQVVAPPHRPVLPVVCLAALPLERAEAEARRLTYEGSRRPFDLARGPLLRLRILRLRRDEHVVLFTMHHIISDGWSAGILLEEMTRLYNARAVGDSPQLPELPIQYADFAAWQRGQATEEHFTSELAWWREQLSGAPEGLDLPTDRPRPAVAREEVGVVATGLEGPRIRRLAELAERHGATLFMAELAALAWLLLRYSNQREVVLGTPVAGRQRVEVERLVGCFVNTLALRVQPAEHTDFLGLLQGVRETTLDAFAHQDLPFEKLVDALRPERSLQMAPLFQVVFVMQNTPGTALSLAGLESIPYEVDSGAAPFDLVWTQAERPEGGWRLSVHYDLDLFYETTVHRLLGHFDNLLSGILEDPRRPLEELSLLAPVERSQLFLEWNDTAFEPSAATGTLERFESWVQRTPEALALVCGSLYLSYQELWERTDALAHTLSDQGVGAEQVVSILAERDLDFWLAVLGVMKAGGAYLPLDPKHPAGRLATIVARSGGSLVLAFEGRREELAEALGESGVGAEVMSLEEILSRSAAPTRERSPSQGSNLAYVLFTSGSTGMPKGAMVTHEGMLNHLVAKIVDLNLEGRDQVAQTASQCFDISIWQFFSALLVGGTVHLVPDAIAHDPAELAGYLERRPVSILETVPSFFRLLCDEVEESGQEGSAFPALRWLMPTGEALPPDLCRRWLERFPHVPVINAYGPTECSDDVSHHVITRLLGESASSIPIGRPLINLQLHIVDRRGRPLPLGVVGELCVGGIGVGRGYLSEPTRTAPVFVPDGVGGAWGGRLYRTGDLARWLPDGSLEFLGRIDHQVKLHGLRIELGEIEVALTEQPEVQEAAVLVREDGPGHAQLVAYVVAENDPQTTAAPEELTDDKLDQWRTIFDVVYRQQREEDGQAAEVNTRVWVSSYTGEAMSQEEITECVEDSVARILALEPRRVLELGCGTGLMLRRVAPHVETFWGTDLSGQVIEDLEKRLAEEDLGPVDIQLRQAGADELEGIPEGAFDLVILNEVVQYFPSVQYLMKVLEGAVKCLAPGGRLFVGGVRNHRLMEDFHASVQLEKAVDELSLEDLRWRIEGAMAREKELLVAPAFWYQLGQHLPRLGRLGIELKGGYSDNELTRFRYDVVLQVPGSEAPVPNLPSRQPWQQAGGTLEALEQRLRRETPESLAFSGVPNARLTGVMGIRRGLHRLAEEEGATAQSLRGLALGGGGNGGAEPVHPDDLRALGRKLGYGVSVTWSAEDSGETLDAFFWRGAAPGLPFTADSIPQLDPSACANAPLRGLLTERLVDRLGGRLAERLPEYMVPGSFIWLEALPRTANGKLDRAALPKVQAGKEDSETVYEAPRTRIEELLTQSWGEVLGLDRVGIRDNFFELGGDSILSIQVVSRARRLGLKLAPRELFEYQTIAELALVARVLDGTELLEGPVDESALVPFAASGLEEKTLVRLRVDHPYMVDAFTLSPLQEGFLYHTLYEPSSSFYLEHLTCHLEGELHVPSFLEAWRQLVIRHDALRSSYHWQDLPHAVQAIHHRATVPLTWIDLSRLSPEQAERERQRLTLPGIDLGQVPTMRLVVFKRSPREHWLLLGYHHIQLDGWSMPILIGEWFELYRATHAAEPSKLGTPPLFRRYIEWHRGQDLTAQESFWRQELADFTAPTPLVMDRPGDLGSARVERHELLLPEVEAQALGDWARRHRLTLNTLLQSVWGLLLSRYSGEEDVVFGATLSGRSVPVEGVKEMVGVFINTLPLRLHVDPEAKLSAWLQEVQRTQLELQEREYTPLHKIREWSEVRGGLSLFDSILVFENHPTDQGLAKGQVTAGLRIRQVVMEGGTNYPLAITVLPDRDLVIRVERRPDQFDETTARRLLAHLGSLLEEVARDVPGRRVGSVPLLRPSEQQQILREWNDTVADSPLNLSLHGLFEERARQSPDALAVVSDKGCLSFRDLGVRAERLARCLGALGVGPETVVALRIGRSPVFLESLLGVLKAGAAFLPLDSNDPPARLEMSLEDSGAVVEILEGEGGGVEIRTLKPASQGGNTSWPPPTPGSESLACVFYTSGSTGRPKGVMVPHGALVRFALEMVKALELGPSDRVLQFASPAFDVVLEEVFPVWWVGGAVVLEPRDNVLNPQLLGSRLERHRVSAMELPASYWHTWMEELSNVESKPPASLRCLMIGTEKPNPQVLESWLTFGVSTLFVFGLTETAVTSSYFSVPRRGRGDLPIGRPVQGTGFFALDHRGDPVPLGARGELYVTGEGVVRGYIGDVRKTAQRFVPDAWSGLPGSRAYRTGDVVAYLPDGNLGFLGRVDNQIKIRGVRVEPGEVAVNLESHPEVVQAAVVVRPGPHGKPQLVAYCVCRNSTGPEGEVLRNFLRKRLPSPMVPAAFVHLEELPLTRNGKLDEKALPDPVATLRPVSQTFRTPMEETIADLWSRLLDVPSVSRDDNFFALGGHSLIETQLVARLSSLCKVQVPLRVLFEAPTLGDFSREVERLMESRAGLEVPSIERIPRDRPLELSFSQERFWYLHQLDPGRGVYNVATALDIDGALDRAMLERTLQEIVRRHEILHSVFRLVADRPAQVVLEAKPSPMPVVDLGGLEAAVREREADRLNGAEARRAFDLAHGPLLRQILLLRGEDRQTLLLTTHHIACDGWSAGIFIHELTALYTALKEERASPLPELALQYADYAGWQRQWLQGQALEEQMGYWRRRLRSIPDLLALPTDWPRPAVQGYEGGGVDAAVEAEVVDKLRQLGTEQGTTLFMTLLTAFKVLLLKLSGQTDIVVGTNVANRTHAETESLIGPFINQLALRSDLSGDLTFLELLASVRTTVLEAWTYQELPFERVVEAVQPERDPSRTPIFQVKIDFDDVPEQLEIPALDFKSRGREKRPAHVDLLLVVENTADQLFLSFDYRLDLFRRSTVQKMLGQLMTLLGEIVAEPGVRLGELVEHLETSERKERDSARESVQAAGLAKLRKLRSRSRARPVSEEPKNA